ncbi:hypothetical protein [Castellaniella sp.]|uniref:hypothetical protein n=1 Tax=Castellaniella sp. TaxID=1955812 RepID=UPI002AFF1F0F|nr:hypothetical protein [Castellaniella sp.]
MTDVADEDELDLISTREALEIIHRQKFYASPHAKDRKAARVAFEEMLKAGEVRLWATKGTVTSIQRWVKNRIQSNAVYEIFTSEEIFATHIIVSNLSIKETSWREGKICTVLINSCTVDNWPYAWRSPRDPGTGRAMVKVCLSGLCVERGALSDASAGDAAVWENGPVRLKLGTFLPASALEIPRPEPKPGDIVPPHLMKGEIARLEEHMRILKERVKLPYCGPIYENEAALWIKAENMERSTQGKRPVGRRAAEGLILERARREGRTIGFDHLRALAIEVSDQCPGYSQNGAKNIKYII